MKTALITGSTDGIGRALAISMAKRGYSIHILGIGEEKGKDVLVQLQKVNPKGKHELFLVDLSTIKSNKEFIDMYNEKYDTLDLLVLNANAMFKEARVNVDGVDMGFMIGYLSRYMFSIGLDKIMKNTKNSRVLHIGGATLVKPIRFDKLSNPDYKGSASTYMGFMANNLFVQFANKKGLTEVPYEFMEPGIVNTNTVKNQNVLVRIISKLMGMIEPEESGERIAMYLEDSQSNGGAFYNLGKRKSPKAVVQNGEDEFMKVLDYSAAITGFKFSD
jgi:short-subunit dehydrogenase